MFNFFKKKKKYSAPDRLSKANIKVNFDFKSFSEKNIFNKLSDNSEYGYFYYPYGYLFRYPKWGTINELGFRNKESLHKVRDLYPNHFIVLVFGTSTVFSILVKDEDTFCYKLEKKLNSNKDLVKKFKKDFKVINMGNPGNCLMNQIINYLSFGYTIKPELVISHYNAGDFPYAQYSDSFLLNNYDITYNDISEVWAKIIHDSNHTIDFDFSNENEKNFKPVIARNNPEKIISACHNRLIQFKNVVETYNTKFIGGFQSWIYSKEDKSKKELESIKNYYRYNQNIYLNIFDLCERYSEKYLKNEDNKFIVNIHDKFKNLNNDVTHFGDVVHTLEPGDEEVSKIYYEKILESYEI